MDKDFRKRFFLICLGGGLVFALVFFLIGFGTDTISLLNRALICLFGGTIWAVMFYFIWLLVARPQKPSSFENPKAQRKLSEHLTVRGQPCRLSCQAYINYGKGLRQEICESCICFEEEIIHIAFCHFGKVYSFDIAYEKVIGAVVTDDNILIVNSAEYGNTVFFVKDPTPQLKEFLVEKGLYLDVDDKMQEDADMQITNRLFEAAAERVGSAYFEFQYCKKSLPVKKLVKAGGYGCWEEDSILVHIDNDVIFFKNYRKYLEPTNAPNGTNEFCYYGVNYYTKEQTAQIVERIKEDKPPEYEVLIKWLERAVTDYNGFYFMGI